MNGHIGCAWRQDGSQDGFCPVLQDFADIAVPIASNRIAGVITGIRFWPVPVACMTGGQNLAAYVQVCARVKHVALVQLISAEIDLIDLSQTYGIIETAFAQKLHRRYGLN